MPYLNIRVSIPESSESAEEIVAVLMKHTSDVLGKKPDVTSIEIDFVSPEKWFVGGGRVSEQKAVTFYLDIKVTDGTNTKSEKAKYVKNVFADFDAMFGPITPASYIVIHDVRADSWGFQGRTQEYRFIQSQPL
jgi:4-oxalocrotonate tautomerase